MNYKSSLHTKYPDLLPPMAEPDLEQLIADLDRLGNTWQPPQDLLRLEVAHSLLARQAESARPVPLRQRLLDKVRHLSYLPYYRRLYPVHPLTILVALFIVVLLGFGVFALSQSQKSRSFNISQRAEPCAAGRVMLQSPNSISFNCFNLTITRVMLDDDRVTIGYLLQGPNSFAYRPAGIRLTDAQGQELKHLASVSDNGPNFDNFGAPIPEGGFYGKGNAAEPGGEEWFDATSLAPNPVNGLLKFHLEIASFQSRLANLRPITLPNGPLSFDLAVPYNSVKSRVVTLNQTDTANGTSAILQKVVVGSNYTRFYLSGVGAEIGYELQAGNTYLDNTTVKSPTSTARIVTTSDGLTLIDLPVSLLNEKGEWTLIVKSPPAQLERKYFPSQRAGPWVFRFNPGDALSTPTAPSPQATAPSSPPTVYAPPTPR